jgi:hypothetical protein
VIFLDSNLFVIDLRYPGDRNAEANREALGLVANRGVGLTSILNLLEVCGILSFNLSPASLFDLYVHFPRRYGITLLEAGGPDQTLPTSTPRELLRRMERGMALKDAEIAGIVERHGAGLRAFLSWNAKHFQGKLPIPALTPAEWLAGNLS